LAETFDPALMHSLFVGGLEHTESLAGPEAEQEKQEAGYFSSILEKVHDTVLSISFRRAFSL